MKSVLFLFLSFGCTSLRNENLKISDYTIQNSKATGFIASKYICMSHIGTTCQWVNWTFPDKEKQIKDLLKEKQMKLISAKYSYRPEGMRWYTILSLGLLPSEMVYKNELKITYGDSMGNEFSHSVNQEYGIMTGWFSAFFGTVKKVSTIHDQKNTEFINSISEKIGKANN